KNLEKNSGSITQGERLNYMIPMEKKLENTQYRDLGGIRTMTNFDFLLSNPQFSTFGEVAIAAEKIYTIDPAACVLNCRRAVEFAVKWMYSVDSGLVMPYDDRLASLMDTEDFRAIVDRDLWQRLKYI